MNRKAFFVSMILPDNILIEKIQQAAKIYQKYVDKDVLIVFANSKKGPFYMYQFHAGAENFQHLAGVKSPNGAKWFYNKALDDKNTLKRNDIVPVDSIATTSSKIEILSNAVNLQDAKVYKFGKHDLVTLKNQFSMAIGNAQNIMGFDKRSNHLPVPVTVLNRSIYEFCSQPLRIFLILLKNVGDDKYHNIFYEITNNVLHKNAFDDSILSLIDCSLWS